MVNMSIVHVFHPHDKSITLWPILKNDWLAMTFKIIEFDGMKVNVTRKAIKHMYFRIQRQDGQLDITAPLHFSDQKIQQQLEVKRDWIRKHQTLIHQAPKPKEPSYKEGDAIQYLGKSYRLTCIEKTKLRLAVLSHDQLILYCPIKANADEKQALLEHWYKQQMKEIIPDLMKQWAKKIGVAPKEWRIKKMKTRWGSCNTKAKRIWLNLNLMHKPLRCIELVLVHELIHLLEPSHNKRFYRLMSLHLPDWKESHNILEGKKTIQVEAAEGAM